jgi:hypothetical protein
MTVPTVSTAPPAPEVPSRPTVGDALRHAVPTRIDVWEEGDVPCSGSGKPDKRAIRERLEEPGR